MPQGLAFHLTMNPRLSATRQNNATLSRDTAQKVLHKVGPIGENETEESSTALGSNADVLQWAADRHMAYCWMWPAALNGLKIEMSDAFACSPVCALRWSECTDRHSVGIRTDKSTDDTLVTLLHTSVTSLNEWGLFPAPLWSPVDTISTTWTRSRIENCQIATRCFTLHFHSHTTTSCGVCGVVELRPTH